ncbi:thioredoxin-like domain-containing protein [Fulvivirga sediminis]|uniref:DUF5106 domain-containing protein n=1 Tax=Fulvivirga sediminis TaxID=2803949 RepID=A0A937F4F5_9BACT|nr:thioredoxin-like domain-containing protein [Fulvivirga sediminis]MBL3656166.1 DUF5106 domain-containing protein [Fulvivirga sediminis]
MQKFLFTFLLSITFLSSHAQNGYKLDFQIHGLADTTIYLGYFFGESTYLTDTAQVDSEGKFTFDGKKPLSKGVYFLVLNKSKLFDIIINEDQTFKIETTRPEFVETAKVTGDVDNDVFFKNMLYNEARNAEAKPQVEMLKDSTSTTAEKEAARAFLNKLNEKVMKHQDEVIEKYPTTLFAKILKANKKIEVPEPPKLDNGAIDSTFSYRYYKSHYWDNFNLGDPAMIRLNEPLYKKKVEDYLDKMLLQHPDTISNAIDELAKVAKKDQDTYKYLIWIVTIKYQQPEIMGLDEVFVHLYDEYFASGEMDFWANAKLKKNLEDRAKQLRNSLIGLKAPNLIMQNEDLKSRALYDMKNKYTVIYFYDPDCGHCKKETPKLKEFYDNSAYDVGIFAVSADTSMVKMKDYIKTMHMEEWTTVNGPRTYTESYRDLYDAMTTPTIYVLNSNKKIIAKKLPAERLEEFLTRYEAIENREQQ